MEFIFVFVARYPGNSRSLGQTSHISFFYFEIIQILKYSAYLVETNGVTRAI